MYSIDFFPYLGLETSQREDIVSITASIVIQIDMNDIGLFISIQGKHILTSGLLLESQTRSMP